MKVQIITIGDEILIGQIVDTNSAWMAKQLNRQGAEVVEIMSVSDTREGIISGLDSAKGVNVVLITGGLGSTKDDITKKVLAEYFGTGMVFNEPTWQHINELFTKWGRLPTDAHRNQCFMPQNAKILTNKMGTAPGMYFQENGKVYISMPGVPYEMKYLMENEVLPCLKKAFPMEMIVHKTILTVGKGESLVATMLEEIEDALPPHIKLAYLPNLGQVRLRLTGRGGTDEQWLFDEIDIHKKKIEETLGNIVFGYDTDTLEIVVGRLLVERKMMLTTAESCTGGRIAHQITSTPGASKYFEGGYVTYSNKMKQEQLGVKEETLKAHGAVSEAVVKEMAQGARKNVGADIAVSVSGIMGPDGGTPEKPVGTVWIGVADKNRVIAEKIQVGKDREKNILYTVTRAMDIVRKFLLGYV